MPEAKIKITAQDQASRVLADVRANMAGLEQGAALLGSALGLIGVSGVAGLIAITRTAVNSVDAFNDLKDATGASIENISALDDVAARTGTSFETVQTALVKFNGVLKDAKPGSDAEKALQALNLNIKELESLDPAQALLQTAQALARFADDGNKARLTQELFGKSLKEVAPFLKDLAEKGALNAKVTTEQAEAAEKFNKELFNLQKNATDSARALSIGLITAINATIEKFREGAKEGKSFYQTLVGEQLRLLGLNDGPSEYAARLGEITEKLKDGNIHASRRAALLREQDALQKKLAAGPDFSADNQSAAELSRLTRRVSLPATFGGKDKTGKAQSEQITDAQRALASYVTSLERVSEKTQDLTEAQKALDFLKGLGTQGEIPQVRELVLGLAEVRLAGDQDLAKAAETALAKITATLPERVQRQAVHAVQQTYRFEKRPPAPAHLAVIRQACWDERALDITYTDRDGSQTQRVIWPLSVVFLDRTLMLLAWCTWRQGFRRFKLDLMGNITLTDTSFRPRRVPLLREFLVQLKGDRQLPSTKPTTNSTL